MCEGHKLCEGGREAGKGGLAAFPGRAPQWRIKMLNTILQCSAQYCTRENEITQTKPKRLERAVKPTGLQGVRGVLVGNERGACLQGVRGALACRE